jgi:hypothetical protein
MITINFDPKSMKITYEQDRRKFKEWFGDEGYCYYSGRYRLLIYHTTQELNTSDVYECNNHSYRVVNIHRDCNTLTNSYELISFTPIV